MAAEQRIGLRLRLLCRYPLLLQPQLTVSLFHLCSCSSALQRTVSYTDEDVSLSLGKFPYFDVLNLVIFPAVHPVAHTAPPSALVPVMTTVAQQPGLPGSSNAFQVRFLHILLIIMSSYILTHLVMFLQILSLCYFCSLTPTHRPLWLHLSCSPLDRSTLHKLSHTWVRALSATMRGKI